MAVHRQEETWLQAQTWSLLQGQPTLRNMGLRCVEHRGSGRSWSEIDVEHRRPMAAALLFGHAFTTDPVMYVSLNRCGGAEGSVHLVLVSTHLMVVIARGDNRA